MRIVKYFTNLKIQSKLIVSFFLAVIIPMLIMGLILIHEFRSTVLEDAVQQSRANVDRVKQRTAETLETTIHIADDLSLDPSLKKLVNRKYTSSREVVKAYREYKGFDNYLNNYKELSNIRLYVDNPLMLNNWAFIPVTDSVEKQFWYRAAEKKKGLYGWYYIPDETAKDQSFLSLVSLIRYEDSKRDSMLVMNINPANLKTILQQEQSPTMIVDENDSVVASNRGEYIGKKLGNIIDMDAAASGQIGTYTGEVNGETAEVIIDLLLPDMSHNKLKFVSVIPNRVIMKDANRFLYTGLFVIAFSIVTAFILICISARIISSRIVALGNQIDEAAEGNLDAVIRIPGTDEIGQLSKRLEYMVRNIKELISELETMHVERNLLEKRQQEIKLKMMASQINPHFLFNALESIRMKAHLQGDKEISKVVKELGRLMRKSIEVTGEMVHLQSELDMVRSYLEIQKFRYEDRLAYEITMDTDTARFLIQPLIIQPLVENAVIHGLENKPEGGKVTVQAGMQNGCLSVRVADNGAGMSREKWSELTAALKHIDPDNENRIGLLNVHQRLVLTFGPESGLVIRSNEGIGTTIEFKIPSGGENNV